MATGDTKLSICSDALIMLGASPLSSFSEGTDAATDYMMIQEIHYYKCILGLLHTKNHN